MRRLHSLAVLAILAALSMAPSSVFAAQPTELGDGRVIPVSSTSITAFVLSVHYRSKPGNPANAVMASVGGQTIELVLVSGTATDGTWAGSSVLPAGSWTVTFRATSSQGSGASLDAGSVHVGGAATPQPSHSGSIPPDTGDDPGDGTVTPAPAPAGTAAPTPDTGYEAPRRTAGANGSPAPARTGGRVSDGPGEKQLPAHRRSSRASRSPATASGATPTPSASSGLAAGEPLANGNLVSLVLLIGFGGVGAVALAGSLWVVLANRRERATNGLPSDARIGQDSAVDAMPLVERRAMRRARLRDTRDPILAGMGLDPEPGEESPSTDRASRRPPRKSATRRRDPEARD